MIDVNLRKSEVGGKHESINFLSEWELKTKVYGSFNLIKKNILRVCIKIYSIYKHQAKSFRVYDTWNEMFNSSNPDSAKYLENFKMKSQKNPKKHLVQFDQFLRRLSQIILRNL